MKLSLARWRHSRQGKAMAIAAACAIVLAVAVGLFVKSYHDSGPTTPYAAPTGAGGTAPGDFFAPSPSPSTSGSPTSGFFPSGGLRSLPAITISGYGGGGLHFSPGSVHHLVVTARSAMPIKVVGFIVPTSQNRPYGQDKGVGTSWSMTTTVYGKPAYAMLFVQAGPTGAPITCTVTVDGHVTSSESTKGPYGRQICLG